MENGLQEGAANQEQLLTPGSLARALQVPLSWVYGKTRIKGGDFPVIRAGKYCRFRLSDVLEYLKKEQEARG